MQPPDIRPADVLLTFKPDGSRALLSVIAPRYPVYQYGDQLEIKGSIQKPTPFDGFDYPLYLERFCIYGTLPEPKKIIWVGHDDPDLLHGALYRLRSRIETEINDSIPEPEASFLAGILLGSQRAIPGSIQTALRQTGTSHIIAISGENITILLVILLRAIPVVGLRARWFVTATASIFVVILTGASASVIRGAVMATIAAFIRSRSRRAWATPLLIVSAVIIVLDNPLLLAADPGCQLSFAALVGLAYFGGWCSRWPLIRRLPPYLGVPLAETVAATIGTAPVSLRVFGVVSWSGFFVNPLVIWLIAPITVLALVLVAGYWVPFLVPLVKLPLWLLLHASLVIIEWFGKLPFGTIQATVGWPATLLTYVGILALAIRLRRVPA
jgi:competence protein ComEC